MVQSCCNSNHRSAKICMRFRPDIRELYVHVHVCCVFVFEYICIDSANAYENTIRISKTLTENHMNNTYHHTSTKLSIVGCDKIEYRVYI